MKSIGIENGYKTLLAAIFGKAVVKDGYWEVLDAQDTQSSGDVPDSPDSDAS